MRFNWQRKLMDWVDKITILSTFAEDKLVNERGSIIRRQKGGPAFYLTRALKSEKHPFTLKSGPVMKVEILITKKGEFGRIPNKLKPKSIRFSAIRTPLLVVSTIMDEFDLKNFPDFKGMIFLDVQGYVRDGNNFGKKKIWKPSKEVMANIFCLKGTKEELKNIPPQFIEAQKRKVLLVTNGKLGCGVFAFGKWYLIKPEKIIRARNTIGAGDTFFAYFVSKFVKTGEILGSVKYATESTSNFLSLQNMHHHN